MISGIEEKKRRSRSSRFKWCITGRGLVFVMPLRSRPTLPCCTVGFLSWLKCFFLNPWLSWWLILYFVIHFPGCRHAPAPSTFEWLVTRDTLIRSGGRGLVSSHLGRITKPTSLPLLLQSDWESVEVSGFFPSSQHYISSTMHGCYRNIFLITTCS